MSESPYPLRTERLTLRFPRTEDVDALTAYRNDPDVAALQDWDLPYPEERARALVARHEGVTDLTAGCQCQVMIERDGLLAGDLYVGLDEHGGVAEIGFTLMRSAQGQGSGSRQPPLWWTTSSSGSGCIGSPPSCRPRTSRPHGCSSGWG